MQIKCFILFIHISVFFSMLGCNSGNVVDDKISNDLLSGNWEKIKPETELGGYYIKIKFEGDKFYYRLWTYIDYIDGKNPCVKKHGWLEYAYGDYTIETGKLFLKGNWYDSTYTVKHDTGCFNTGIFNESYFYDLKNDSLILNKNEANFDDKKQYNHIYDKLTFVKR